MSPYRKQRGFTLMELMIVVAILAILTMAAIPSLQNYLATSRMNVHLNNYDEAQRFVAGECAKAVAGGATVNVITTLNSNGSKTAPGNKADPLAPAFATTPDGSDSSGQVIITGLNNDGTVNPGTNVTISLGTVPVTGATASQYPGGSGNTMPPATTINCASN